MVQKMQPSSPPSPLLLLPQELLVRISTFLSTSELGPLRQTCKEIEARLFTDFASTFFSKRQFMIEHVSLTALVGIANHPGLAPYLVDVIISTQMLRSYDSHVAEANYLQGRFIDRDGLLYTGMARDMLVEAFSKLPNLRSIGIRDYNGAGRVRDGPNASWRSWGWSYGSSEQGTGTTLPSPILPLLLSTLADAGAHPSKLEVFLRSSTVALGPTAFMIPESDRTSRIYSLLSKFTVVMLAINFAPYYSVPGEVDQPPSQFPLRTFLKAIPNVEVLRLNFLIAEAQAASFLQWFGSKEEDKAASTVLQRAPQAAFSLPLALPKLTRLDLGKATMSVSILVKALTKFDLVSISLWDIALIHDLGEIDLWESALTELSAQTSSFSRLGYVLLGRARQTTGKAYTGMSRMVEFVPEGTSDEDKEKALHVNRIEFKKQYTAVPVHEWFKAMAKCTFVRGIHTVHGRVSIAPSVSSEDDLDDSEDEENEDENEDDNDDEHDIDDIDADEDEDEDEGNRQHL